MWRANRLVDALAKIAAAGDRAPAWAIQCLEDSGELVRHSAAKLGTVTYRANHHEISEVIDGGAIVTRRIRDSTAEQRQPFRRAKTVSGSTQQLEMPAPAPVRSLVCMTPRSCRGAKHGSRHRKAVSITIAKKKSKLREDLVEQEQVARWIATRDLAPRRGATADERIQRIRNKVARGGDRGSYRVS